MRKKTPNLPGAVVSSAVRAAGEALQFASPALRGDRATVRQAVQQMGGAIWRRNGHEMAMKWP